MQILLHTTLLYLTTIALALPNPPDPQTTPPKYGYIATYAGLHRNTRLLSSMPTAPDAIIHPGLAVNPGDDRCVSFSSGTNNIGITWGTAEQAFIYYKDERCAVDLGFIASPDHQGVQPPISHYADAQEYHDVHNRTGSKAPTSGHGKRGRGGFECYDSSDYKEPWRAVSFWQG